MKVDKVTKVWDSGKHCAFTDLCMFNGSLWLCFREGDSHVSPDGQVLILTFNSSDNSWQEQARITLADADLRDPKLMVFEEQLMLTCAAKQGFDERPYHQSYLSWSSDGKQWSDLKPVAEKSMWLWRSRALSDGIYSIGYKAAEQQVTLYRMEQRAYQPWVAPLFSKQLNGLGYPNEHDMCLVDGNRAACLLRRDADTASAQLGIADPPYTNWQWHDLGTRIGGPAMIKLSNEQLLCAVRLYEPVRTSLCWLHLGDKPELEEILTLPSGGDCSYPGLVQQGEKIYCSYYSSHEDNCSVYFAELSL